MTDMPPVPPRTSTVPDGNPTRPVRRIRALSLLSGLLGGKGGTAVRLALWECALRVVLHALDYVAYHRNGVAQRGTALPTLDYSDPDCDCG